MDREREKKRLSNIREVLEGIEVNKCMRVVTIQNYCPGHIRYHFGHHPSRKPYNPGKEDWDLLKEYSNNGVDIIHLWWWDDEGGYEKGKLNARNPKGVNEFIKMVHQSKMKVIPYVSTGFYDVKDPNYNPVWSTKGPHLTEACYDMDYCCPGSVSWRTYFLNRIKELFEKYKFDGMYNDGGISESCKNENSDHIHLPKYSYLWEDFLAEFYRLVKSYNGILVFHYGSDEKPPFKKFWDYYLVGESTRNIKSSLIKTKNYPLYVIRFSDWSRLITDEDLVPDLSLVPKIEDLIYAGSIPYLQFPWIEGGNYGEGEDMFSIPKIKWIAGENDIWTKWIKRQKEAGLKGVMGGSLGIENKKKWYELLKIYKEITKDDTMCFIEVKGMNKFLNVYIPNNIVISIFANEELYIVVSNLGEKTYSFNLTCTFQDLLTGEKVREVFLHPETMVILKK